jgi:hypothetical protein
MGYSVISEGLVLIAAVIAATSMAMAVISNLQQLQELQSSIVRDLRDRAATKLAVVAVIESPSQPGQVFRVYLKNVGLRELTLAELQGMTAMIVSNSWAGVLRYSADGSPGTWSIEGEVRTVLRGETFVIRLHMPTSLGRGEHHVGEWEWAVHGLWKAGVNVLSFREGQSVVLQPVDGWVRLSDVRASGPATVYDLVLEGGTYNMAGEGPVLPMMDTGHGVISTFHAGSVQKLIQRLVSDPINVPKTFIDNLNCVVLQSAVLHPHTGKLERRVLSFNEILGVDAETGGVNYVEVFSWNPVTDMHEFRGEGTSYLLEEKVARMRGIPRREIRRIYAELRLRAEFIRKLIQLGVYEYKDVFRAVAHAYTVGVERALQEVEVVARQGAEQRR